MKVLLVGSYILYKNKSGDYFAPAIYSYDFMKRYLSTFDEVKLISKIVSDQEFDEKKMNIVSGKGVEILELPYYHGIRGMMKCFGKLVKVYKKADCDCDCCIYRIAQMESFFAYVFRNRKIPFAVEVVNDPDTFVDMGIIMRKICVKMVEIMTKRANGVSYVTKNYLQKKYPHNRKDKKTFVSYYSSVDLEKKDISKLPKKYNNVKIFKIVHVSNAINSDIKGHYTLINAFKNVCEYYDNVQLIIVGDGNKLFEYKSYVKDIGLEKKVLFTGRISDKKELNRILHEADLMVLPTKMEGLPRTIIEAMAVGLPCLSSPTAGVPELIDKQYLFSPDDVSGFANEIMYLLEHHDELERMSEINIKKSYEYESVVLQQRRGEFYNSLKNVCLEMK